MHQLLILASKATKEIKAFKGQINFIGTVPLKTSLSCLPYLLTAANWRGAQVEISSKKKRPLVSVCVLQLSVKVMLDQENTVLSFSSLQILCWLSLLCCSPRPPLTPFQSKWKLCVADLETKSHPSHFCLAHSLSLTLLPFHFPPLPFSPSILHMPPPSPPLCPSRHPRLILLESWPSEADRNSEPRVCSHESVSAGRGEIWTVKYECGALLGCREAVSLTQGGENRRALTCESVWYYSALHLPPIWVRYLPYKHTKTKAPDSGFTEFKPCSGWQ